MVPAAHGTDAILDAMLSPIPDPRPPRKEVVPDCRTERDVVAKDLLSSHESFSTRIDLEMKMTILVEKDSWFSRGLQVITQLSGVYPGS